MSPIGHDKRLALVCDTNVHILIGRLVADIQQGVYKDTRRTCVQVCSFRNNPMMHYKTRGRQLKIQTDFNQVQVVIGVLGILSPNANHEVPTNF